VLVLKGGVLEGRVLAADDVRSLARLPAREVLTAQFAGVVASPLTGLVRGLGSLVSGLAVALGQVRDQKEAESPAPAEAPPAEEPAAEEAAAEEAGPEPEEQSEAAEEEAQ
jgi:large subunit ribosomal protein L10